MAFSLETPRRDASAEFLSRTFSEHLPHLVRSARAVLGDDDLALEAVQETLVRVWARGWLPPEPRAALIHLVVRSSLHLLRCQRRRSDHEGAASRTDVACCEDDPLRLLEGREIGETLRRALDDLKPSYRATFELFELEGLSYAGVAERMGVPIGTVRSRLCRARAHLRVKLGARFEAA